jgi:hypothetical protein
MCKEFLDVGELKGMEGGVDMFLENNIGKFIYVDLTDAARASKVVDLFYNTEGSKDLISNKLLGFDNNGIWIEGFKEFTRLVDENNAPLPKENQVKENGEFGVFIPWNYISGLFLDKNITQSRIGF